MEFPGSLRLKYKLENTAMSLWVNKVKEKIANYIKSLKKAKQLYKTSPVRKHEEVRQYLKDLQTKFCISPLQKSIKHHFLLFLRDIMFLTC